MKSGWHLAAMILALGASCALPAFGQPLAPEPDLRGDAGGDSDACAGGVVPDDGSAETGYGWVPSVIEGEYVQEFDSSQFPSDRLQSVCICWLRTRTDATIDFEIVFYRQVRVLEAGRLGPAAEPYAAVAASAEVVPVGITESFFEVDVTGVRLPPGKSYIGARWDASSDQFFFICTDTSDATPRVEVFFRDDRSPDSEWTSVFNTTDPIFVEHRSMMVRALAGPELPVEVPALGGAARWLLGLALAASALAALRQVRRRSAPLG